MAIDVKTDTAGGAGIAPLSSVAQNAVNAVVNFQNNQRNAEINRRNNLTQLAYNSAQIASNRQYDSPTEQMRRLSDAGVNAFTAQDMIQNNQSQNGSYSPSAPQLQPFMADFSAITDAISDLQTLQFTKEENRLNREHAIDMLMKSASESATTATKLAEKQNEYTLQQIQETADEQRKTEQLKHTQSKEIQSLEHKQQTKENKATRQLEEKKHTETMTQRKFEFNEMLMNQKHEFIEKCNQEAKRLGLQENQDYVNIAFRLLDTGLDLYSRGNSVTEVAKQVVKLWAKQASKKKK